MASPRASLLIHTLNVTKELKPSTHGQAADAIHQTLHFALDGQTQDWQLSVQEWLHQGQDSGCGSVSRDANGLLSQSRVKPGFIEQPLAALRPQRPYVSYLHHTPSSTLYIPHPAAVPDPLCTDPCAVADRDGFDVTVKVFLQADDSQEDLDQVQRSLEAFQRNTGLLTIDTLILSWPSITQPWTASQQSATMTPSDREHFNRHLRRISTVWQHVSQSPHVASLGLCDLPLVFLQALFPSPSSEQPLDSPPPSPPTVPSDNRLPRIVSYSQDIGPICAPQNQLVAWCKSWSWGTNENRQQSVQIQSHSHPQEILPRQSLSSLLEEFHDRLPDIEQDTNWTQDIVAKCILKYTVLISDRGILADAGYLVLAQAQ
ncbi:unnamed protein product [Sympodiomycopsis kandeliae]